MQATESTIDQLNDILKSAQEKGTEALNGTDNTSDDQDLGTAMQSYSSELVSTLNSSFSGKYIFGEGTNGPAPFEMDTSNASNPQLMYYNYNSSTPEYVPVSSMTQSDVSSMKLSMPVDLNLGVKVSSDGSIQQGTVFDAATSGLDTIISGWTDGTSDGSSGGTATNIVDQLAQAANDLNSGDTSKLNNLLGNIQDAQSAVLKVDVGIGEKNDMLSFISSKLTDDQTNISTQMSNAMQADPTQAIMQYNMSETVYKESLSVSSTVLQESLIDFLK
jgi:flagellar hook-associated protein 3 FlgL